MAAQSSFDITTGCDLQEVDNAVNQARKELGTRYDFKGVSFTIDFRRAENTVSLAAPDSYRLDAIWDVVSGKMVRRGVPLQNLQRGDVVPASGSSVRQEVKLQQSIETECAKKIVKFLKEQRLKKVQAAILGEQVRVSGPSRDDLQAAMQALRREDFGVDLQFGNYR
ncbi:MAG: YajQ family cyclic di-GMP-binding protein [Deltaproteobacteria bacterium]|nr:MAG: YajQ family cyclic di-GMP-binding protein [Deltaproteobacteria bacterium]